MKFRGDAFTAAIRLKIKIVRVRYNKMYKASFTDDHSDSYDEAQRLSGLLGGLEYFLYEYIEFKRNERKKNER